MAKTKTKLISIKKADVIKFDRRLPALLEELGMKGNPESFSGLVQKVVLNGEVMTKAELQEFSGKESYTSRDKYLVVIW